MAKRIKRGPLCGIIVVTQVIGALSSAFSGNIRQHYQALVKPALSPPGWLFGVVWPVLYLLMAGAAYMVYQRRDCESGKVAMKLYWVQLLVNFVWPIIFFRFEYYWLSVLIVFALDILAALTLVYFSKTHKAAGYLLVPYLIWLIFASYLNVGIAVLN